MGFLSAAFAFIMAHGSEIATVAGIVFGAVYHAKSAASSATTAQRNDDIVSQIASFLNSYVTTANVNTTVESLRIELRGQVAVLLAKMGITEDSVTRELIDFGINAAIEAAINKFVTTHPFPRELKVDASHVAPATFSPAKGT